ncbi:DUF3810 domain-containing protein [Flaviaesturariibacter flavus]|uniref:DUF3810 domain-containing protein n=1 Tax=Flaviaesturariibacter flavus TaxID=2502780 RepID=A0A4R1BP03_9BACT|nr:DUF3810 domain-containing protein [Flaviaesturariibacter flavus]TCJ19353.1 DUF3810 domain-containing protein [Flaviaesturariibacter flavus]
MTGKSPFRDPFLLILAAAVVVVQVFSSDAGRVERWYSQGLYPPLSRGLRALFGWVPFSIGDLLYGAAVVYLAWQLFRFLRRAAQRKLALGNWARPLSRAAKIALSVYLLFQLLWGLNYSRTDIAHSLDLHLEPRDTALLPGLAHLLQARLCTWGDRVDTARRGRLARHGVLFGEAVAAYQKAAGPYPFLAYSNPSIKPSLLSPVGHYFGFTGYYNPFTAEAQVHTGIPVFIRPFVVCHEMGHQLGYAKENEANFAGFLAGRASGNPDFVYAAYYEMYSYVLADYSAMDPMEAYVLRRTAHFRVRRDRREYLRYVMRTRNSVEPLVMKFYDQYLKLNNQKKGIETYDEVVRWLLAYYKKYGADAI